MTASTGVRTILEFVRRHSTSGLGGRLVATTLWAALAEALSRGLLMVALLFVARALGKESYGQFGMVRSTITMFAVVGGMGLGLTANRFVAEHRDRDKSYSGSIIGASYLVAVVAGSAVGLCLFFGSTWLAESYLEAPELVGGLRIASGLLVLGAVNGAQSGILQGLEAYRRLAAMSLLQGMLALVSLIIGARYFGLHGALVGLLVYSCGGALILHWAITAELRRQRIAIRYTDVRTTLPIFWRFSLPIVLAGMAIAPLKWFAETMLVRRNGFGELGILHAAFIMSTTLIALVSTLNAPLISLMANAGEAAATRKRQYLTLYGSWYACLILALPLVLFPQIVSLFFGRGYVSPQFHAVSVLLILYCALMMYSQGVTRIVALQGSMWFGFYSNLIEGTTLVLGFVALSDRGVVGLAAAYVLSYVVRVAVAVPLLIRQRLVPAGLLLDKYFALTLLLLVSTVAMQLARLS